MKLIKKCKKIIDTQYERTKRILTENRNLLDLIATTLMDKETLNAQEIEHLRDHGVLPEPEVVEKLDAPKAEAQPMLEKVGQQPILKKRVVK